MATNVQLQFQFPSPPRFSYKVVERKESDSCYVLRYYHCDDIAGDQICCLDSFASKTTAKRFADTYGLQFRP
jgi:hypothetical protein